MKKFCFLILFFSVVILPVKADTIYLQECEYTDEYIKWLKLSNEEKENVIMPTMCKNLNNNSFNLVGGSNKTLVGASASDTKFNLKNYNYVPSVKNQENTMACWAFATNTSIESNLLVNGLGSYDLSEAHLELATQDTYAYNRTTFSRDINIGGNYYISSAYLRNNWGSVKETTLPFNRLVDFYNNKVSITTNEIIDNKAMLDVNSIVMFGNDGACSNSTITDIKEYLISNGALSATMYFGNISSHNLYQYYDGLAYKDVYGNSVAANQVINHAVTIVGWDDTISKNNFYGDNIPSRNGAFIIQNSYGTEEIIDLSDYKEQVYAIYQAELNNQGIYSASNIPDSFIIQVMALSNKLEETQIAIEGDSIIVEYGNAGYQYVSYDDVRVCNNLAGFFDVNTEVEDYVYGYDNLGLTATTTLVGKTAYLANTFAKQSSKDETLEELNIYFSKIGQNYEIYFADKETKDISLAKKIASGTSKFEGYNTIKFDTKEKITSNNFSIIVKITDTENVVLGVTAKLQGLTEDIMFTDGVQFLSVDGTTYADVIESSNQPFHLLIKAYTNEVEEVVEQPDDNTSSEDAEIPDNSNSEGTDEGTTTTPENPDDENVNNGDTIVSPETPSEENKDTTNENGVIEVKPNDYNSNNKLSGTDTPIDNPKTGYLSLLIFAFGFTVLFGIKNIIGNKNKVFKI